MTIGEIDCRLDSGIMKHKAKYPKKNIKDLITTTVENYLVYVFNKNVSYQHSVIIQGVPCPNIDADNYPKKEFMQLVEMIKMFNSELKNKSKEKGFGFLDIHGLTDRGDGFSNAVWHLDDYHISPDGMLEAWNRYALEQDTDNA